MTVFEQVKDRLDLESIDPRTEASRAWFMKNVDTIKSGGKKRLLGEPPLKQTAKVRPGMMYLFFYAPKGRKTLPYYDTFPLILLVDTHNDGMTGLNLHYLPIDLRQKLFYGLLNRVNNNKMNEDTYIKMSYDYLKSARSTKEYKPCFKKYLSKQIRGSIAHVPANEWETAIHLPLASFKKESETTVHRRSKEIIQRF